MVLNYKINWRSYIDRREKCSLRFEPHKLFSNNKSSFFISNLKNILLSLWNLSYIHNYKNVFMDEFLKFFFSILFTVYSNPLRSKLHSIQVSYCPKIIYQHKYIWCILLCNRGGRNRRALEFQVASNKKISTKLQYIRTTKTANS